MPWECKTVEKQRLEFVTKALETNNFSALCREYEITRKTGRKWVDRFKQGLPLTDMSRRPLGHATSVKQFNILIFASFTC